MLLTLLLPLFLIAGLGWLFARTTWLGPGWQEGVGQVTSRLLIPALLLNGTYKSGWPASASWQLLAAYYVPLIVLFLAAAYLRRRTDNGAARALAATYSNTVFVGIPVLVQTMGSESLRFAYPVIAFHSLVAFTLYYLATPHAQAGWRRAVSSLANAAGNPIVVSLLLGLALNIGGVALPAALTSILGMLSAAALPCALLALGASLAGLHIEGMKEALAIAATKLIVFPACVLFLAVRVFDLPAPVWPVLVVIASCPVGVNVAVVVSADRKDAGLVSSAILLSSLACAATIPFWLWILKLA